MGQWLELGVRVGLVVHRLQTCLHNKLDWKADVFSGPLTKEIQEQFKTRASWWHATTYPCAKCVPQVLIHGAITCDSFKVLAQKA